MKVLLIVVCTAISLFAFGAPAPAAPAALLVVGNTNLNSGDLALKNKLQSLGFIVTVKQAASAVSGDATGKNLVLLSSTVASGDISNKFTHVAVPLINCENALFDDLEMTGTASSSYGNQSSLTQIKIINAAHPLAAGLPNGNVAVCSVFDGLSWGHPAATAIKIATLTGDAQKFPVFGYEEGVMMDGLAAPARRVGFFVDDDGASLLTSAGNQLLDAAILWAANVSAQNLAPTVALTAPESGATFTPGSDIAISAEASDADGNITQVKIYQGTVLLHTDFTSPYAFIWNDVAAGSYTLTAWAYDNENDSSAHSVTISVEAPNSAPSVTLTSPAQSALFIAPATINITADAEDSDGSISQVQFYSGSLLLGTDFTGGYSFAWNDVAAGNYTLTAKATDDLGKSAASAPVHITVEDTTTPQATVKNALLVVGNTTLNIGDAAIKNRLETLGFTVEVRAADVVAANDATGKNLVVISSTVASADVDDAFTSVATPVLLCEAGLFDDMKMTASGGSNAGSQSSEDQVVIANSAHPLAAGLSAGTTFIYTKNEVITWGKPAAAAAVIAGLPGNASKVTIFGYDKNAVMQGMVAPARRTGFFLNDNGAAFLSADGWKLFDAAVSWTANSLVVAQTNAPPVVSLASPANNAAFTAPASITITANAADSDGTIAKVEFYAGNDLIGTDLNSPFSYTWNNVAAGDYQLKAKATDNDGATVFSSAISITVEAQDAPPVEEPSELPFTVRITNPVAHSVFLEGADVIVKAKIEATGPQQQPYLKVTNNTASSWKKLKMGYNAGSIYGSDHNVIAGGNNRLEITLRDFNGTAQWNKMQFKPNGSSKSPSSLQNYVTAAGGIGDAWKTISIPLADFPGFDFTEVTYIEFPACRGTAQFEIGIQKIVFTGGSAPFVWFGGDKTDNGHDGSGGSGTLLAELITSAALPSISKVEFYRGNNLLGTDVSNPFEVTWNNPPVGNFTLTARAYQNDQFVASSPIQVHIEEAIGDTLEIIVTFDAPPSACSVQKAPLKYNKDFAYSYTQDDGYMDGYRIAYKMFSGGLNEYDNVTYPGMYYTDGCGNNIAFKAGIALHSVNGLGQDLHESRSTDNRLTWEEVIELHAAGWDIINHSYSHAANGVNTDHAYQVAQNTAYVKSKTGIDMTHFAVPSGDERYVTPAFNNGMVAVYDQTGSGFYNDIVQVDAPLNLNQFKLKRHFIQNGSHNESNITEHLDEAARLSVNGKHYWYNNASHNVSTDFNGTLVYPLFKYFIQYVDETHGKNGSDRMWMAPLQEVYEYLAVKQAVVVSSQLQGNQLKIKLLLHNVPDRLRRYALTLNIDADEDFNEVTVNGTSSYCFDGTGSEKLINLDWTATHPDKIFKTSGSPANDVKAATPANEVLHMDIAPNPVTDVLTVRFLNPAACEVQLEIFDLLGRSIANSNETLQEGHAQVRIDLSNQSAGVYLIKARTAGGATRIEKFVKR